MRSPHRVQIGGLHQADVFEHGGLVEDVAGLVVMLVQVGALELDPSAVDQETPVDDLGGAETDLLRHGFQHRALSSSVSCITRV